MNIPCIAHRIEKAKEHSHLARLHIQTTARMLQEGDYRRGELFYCLKVLKDVEDDYDRVLRLLGGMDPGEDEDSEEVFYDCYYGRTEEDYE